MNSAELITALRWCGDENNEWCVLEEYKCPLWNEDRMIDECKEELMRAAADALEAAEKRIAELEAKMPKEGEWIGIDGTMFSECSVCGERHYGCETPFCDMCGAKMRRDTK